MKSRVQSLSDDQLESAIKALAQEERERIADLLEHLAEFDRRALPSTRGRSSLWAYCTLTLKYSEREAWVRVQASRAATRVEGALDLLRQGKLQLCVLAVLNAHLKPDNAQILLQSAQGKSLREVESMLAALAPKPDKPDSERVLSAPPPKPSIQAHTAAIAGELPLAATTPSDAPPAEIRIHFGFTGSEELRKKLDRAKQVLWHKFPSGRLEDVIGQALDDLLDKRDPDRRTAAPRKPATKEEETNRRYIPVWVRADVWKRDGGCCAYTTSDGVRCGEKSALEYDHVVPWALGGPSDEPDNIRLLCRAHNQLLARETFGEAAGRAAA